MRWLLVGLPLTICGLVWLWIGVIDGPGPDKILMLTCGIGYGAIGFGAISTNRIICRIAIVAWVPLLALFPIGTILGIFAIKNLRGNQNTRQFIVDTVGSLPFEEVAEIVRRQAQQSLSLSRDQLAASLENDLGVAPGRLNSFLDDLGIDFRLPISSNDRQDIESIEDVIELLRRRRTNHPNQAQHAER